MKKNLSKRIGWLFVLLAICFSCGQFIQSTQSDFDHKINPLTHQTHGAIIFSGNINGELEPCGCRKFPLGGIAQVKGLIENAKKNHPLIYVDVGDTFFPSPVVPTNMRRSLSTTASALNYALEQMPLSLYLPGDQDFALGLEYLENISLTSSYRFIISNLAPQKTKIKSVPHFIFQVGERKIIFIGVIDPEVLQEKYQAYFLPIKESIGHQLKELSSQIDSDDLVILLSHSGMETDTQLAQLFPRINWILGAHSQSYTTSVVIEGKTNLVQVLSRNHYLGQIIFPLSGKDSGEFSLLESREETAELIKPNPMLTFVEKYRQSLKDVQAVEQKEMMGSEINPQNLLTTNHQCMSCHKAQSDFWQTTAHSISYATLVKKDAQHNSQCIGCHSLGYQKEKGFSSSHNIFHGKKIAESQKKVYWQTFSHIFKKTPSIREMASTERKKLSDFWIKLDHKNKITHQFANVQCLHCHEVATDHPIKMLPKQSMQDKCLQCHTTDQSPEWFDQGKVNSQLVQTKIKSVACPAIFNE